MEVNMKPIILNRNITGTDPEILARLDEEIKKVEGRARTRTLVAAQICEVLDHVDHELNISKKAKEGIVADVDYNAQDFPGAYKYEPISTYFIALFKNGSWRVTSIGRARTKPYSQRVTLRLTKEAQSALISRFEVFR